MRFLRGGREGEERDRSERGWAGLADRCWGGVLEDGGSEGSTMGRLPVRTGGTVAGPDGCGDAWRSFLDGLDGDISILICGMHV